ncbi:MAG TPA: hypothetical protein VF128_11910 [Gemmatimonadaceae bacterium]
MKRISFLALLLVTPAPLAIVACSDTQSPGAVETEERRVSPAAVNSRVVQWMDDHVVWVQVPVRATQIMLLLPGTYGRPDNGRSIGQVAAEQGYRVVGLMYADDVAVVTACANDASPVCMERVRAEIIRGTNESPHVTVDLDNSIDGRLADLLRYLQQHFPGEEWDQFLDSNGGPRWDRIAVGGLSQGGGHAAFIGKLRQVPRVVMFGAPADGYNSQVAPWMQIGSTPANRYFGFRHARDPFTSIEPNWFALGLQAFGPVTSVDAGSNSTFGGSHMLVTDAMPATGTYEHAHPSVFADGATPIRQDGTPLFDRVWRYLLGRAGE